MGEVAALNPVAIRVAAMDLLARREHTLQELRRKLARRFPDEQLVELELLRLGEDNLQSDQRFAQSFVRQRAARGKGPLRLRQEMRERGVSDTDIQHAMESTEVDWYALAAEVLLKKFGDTRSMDLKTKARCFRFMQYRGFSSDHYLKLVGR